MRREGGLTQLKRRGLDMVHAVFVFGVAAYNLVRLPKLLASMGEVVQPRNRMNHLRRTNFAPPYLLAAVTFSAALEPDARFSYCS